MVTVAVNNGVGLLFAIAALIFSWYRETKTIPKMVDSFTATLNAAQTSFESRNNTSLETFRLALKEERDSCNKWHEESYGRADRLLDEVKELRHFMRSISHQLGLKAALDEQRKKHNEGGS